MKLPVFAAVFAAFASASAGASSTLLFSAPVGPDEASKASRFAINPELGRAWVEVDIAPRNSESTDFHRVMVPGLSYRADTAQVVYEAAGRSVVCAEVASTGRWVFERQRIVPTGACELVKRYVTVKQDDGFEVDQVERVKLFLEIPGSADANTGVVGTAG